MACCRFALRAGVDRFLNSGESLVSTGKCSFRLVMVDRFPDDGFAGRQDRREEVHFAVQSP